MSHFSETLKQLRHKKGMGQKQLSSYLHCSVGTISNYESGTHCQIGRASCRERVWYLV